LHHENQIEKPGCSRFDVNLGVPTWRSRWLNRAYARRSNAMNLPPEADFHEDIRLLIWRPRGLVNEAAVNKIVTVLGELEGKLHEPFNRFANTFEADEVELNFKYVIHVSLYHSLRPSARTADTGFTDKGARIRRAQGSRAVARGADRSANTGVRSRRSE